MPEITKETLLKAEDAKNRDAILYDMLDNIDKKLDAVLQLQKDVDSFKSQVSLLKRIFIVVVGVFSAVATWMELH